MPAVSRDDMSLDTREAFERGLNHFSAFADAYSADDVHSQWLCLLQFAVLVGDQDDLLVLLKAAHGTLARPVAMRVLLATLDFVPHAYQRLSPGAAERLLRQCLSWAGSHADGDWWHLLERFRQVCVPLPKPVESGLKWMLLRLLGVNVGAVSPQALMRLTMAFGVGPLCGDVAAASSRVGGNLPLAPESPFTKLPQDVQRVILAWVLEDLVSVQRYGKGLMSVCKGINALAAPLLQSFEETLPHYWCDASRLKASPRASVLGWVAVMARRIFEPLQQCWPSETNAVEQSKWNALVNSMRSETHKMAWAVCQLQNAEQMGAAMTALFDGIREHEKGPNYLHDLPDTFAQMVCLAAADASHFGALLATLLKCIDNWSVEASFFNGIWLHVEACAPADVRDAFDRRRKAALQENEPPGFLYAKILDILSPAQGFGALRSLRSLLGGTSLSWLQLIGKTHQASEAKACGLVESASWWDYAQTEVAQFLWHLHKALPRQAPVPVAVFEHVPLKLLRQAFTVLEPTLRQALLRRPAVFSGSGGCLQLPLLCDYCLDEAIDPDSRMAFLRWWVAAQEPEAVSGWGALALQWVVPPQEPSDEYVFRRAQGGERFQAGISEVRSLLALGMWSDSQLRAWLTQLLFRATGAADIDQVLALAEQQLPKPIHKDFWLQVLDWMPLICEDDPAMPGPLQVCLAAIQSFPEDDQLELLTAFSEASVLLPLPTALWMCLVLRQQCGEAGFSVTLLQRLRVEQLKVLEAHFHDMRMTKGWTLAEEALQRLDAEFDKTDGIVDAALIGEALSEFRDRAIRPAADGTDSD